MVTLRRTAAVFLCLMLCICNFVGCKNKENSVSTEALVSEIKTYTDEDIVWVELRQDEIISYFGFDGKISDTHTALINDSEEKFDIVSAFVIPEHEDMHLAVEMATVSLDSAAKNFIAANENEANKIRDRIILCRDDTLVIVVSSNSAKIRDMLQEKGFAAVE